MSGKLQVHLVMNGQCFEELGLVSLSAGWQMLQTEGNRRAAEQAPPVVYECRGCEAPPTRL